MDKEQYAVALLLSIYLESEGLKYIRARLTKAVQFRFSIAVIYVTKSRTGNYDFRACAHTWGFPGSTVFGRTHMLRRVCRAITR